VNLKNNMRVRDIVRDGYQLLIRYMPKPAFRSEAGPIEDRDFVISSCGTVITLRRGIRNLRREWIIGLAVGNLGSATHSLHEE
jgi:hypothetical protein